MTKALVTKTVLVMCAITILAFSAANAFANGSGLMPGWLGYLAGSALVALLVLFGEFGKLMVEAFARRALISGLILLVYWLGAGALVLAMSVGRVAEHRTQKVETAQQQIDRHQRAKANWDRINGEIKAADARGVSFKRVAELRQQLRAAESELEAGSAASSDPQADELSWVTGSRVDPATIGKALPVWLAVTLDLAYGGARMATRMVSDDRQQEPAPPVQEKPSSRKRSRGKAGRKKRQERDKPKSNPVDKYPMIVDKPRVPLAAANETLH